MSKVNITHQKTLKQYTDARKPQSKQYIPKKSVIGKQYLPEKHWQ